MDTTGRMELRRLAFLTMISPREERTPCIDDRRLGMRAAVHIPGKRLVTAGNLFHIQNEVSSDQSSSILTIMDHS